MRKSKMKCMCTVCNSIVHKKLNESDLHFFVGSNESNCSAQLEKFESDFEFESVIHWDVGYTETARYFIYRDSVGDAVAWYDVMNSCGFKKVNSLV
jgi:hypothetical protein